MSEPFRYHVADLFTGEEIDEFEAVDFEWTTTLSRPGGWKCKLPMRHEKAARSTFAVGARSVYVTRGGNVLFGGMLWSSGAQSSGETPLVTFGGQGHFHYYRGERRKIRSRLGMTYATGDNAMEITFAAVDQFRIVDDLLDHAAAFAGAANVGYAAVNMHGPGVGGLSGVTRDRTYWSYEGKPIGEAIEQLAAVEDGFDFSESWGFSAGLFTRSLDLWYPRKGNRENRVFEIGKNVVLLDENQDAEQLATRAFNYGSGQDDAILTAEAVDASMEYPAGAYPLMETSEHYRDVSEQATLNAHAQRDLRAASIVGQTVNVEVVESVDTTIETVGEGDTVRLIADDGFVQLDDYMRVVSKTVSVNANGFPTMKMTLVNEAASLAVL